MPPNASPDQPLLTELDLAGFPATIGGVPWWENPAVYGVGGMIALLGFLILIAFRNNAAEVNRAKNIHSALHEFGFTYQRDNEVPFLIVMRQFLIGYGEAGGQIRSRFEAILSEGRTMQLMDFVYPIRTNRRTAFPFMTVALRALFKPAALEALEQFPGLSVEGCGNYLLVYWRYKRLKPAKWPKRQEEAKKVAQAFANIA
jgi:hypothetical protein